MNHLPSTFPPDFLARLREIVPPERYDGVAATFEEPRAVGFRVNRLRASAEDVAPTLEQAGLTLHAVPWHPDAFWVPAEERAALLATEAYAACRIYAQNLASMVPPLVLAPEPGERVLDLAAAPGSKTLQLAQQMQAGLAENTGELVAVEVVKSRYYKLRDNLRQQGSDALVYPLHQDGTKAWRYRPEHFDRVLLDAPCSTEGRFHVTEPETYAYWSPRKIKEMAHKQRKLLFSAVQCTKPGGVVVYSTCSFAPEENEAVLDKLLTTFGGAVELEPIDLLVGLPNALAPLPEWQGRPFKHDLRAARRLLPTRADAGSMEGFFVARLRKTASTLR